MAMYTKAELQKMLEDDFSVTMDAIIEVWEGEFIELHDCRGLTLKGMAEFFGVSEDTMCDALTRDGDHGNCRHEDMDKHGWVVFETV